jgi:addiction module RelB/DinJ family antitoxin
MDSQLKEHVEYILEQFGLSMTAVVNMLFRQIVREQAIPLSLTLNPQMSVAEELQVAMYERRTGYRGRTAFDVANDMESIVAEAAYDKKEV